VLQDSGVHVIAEDRSAAEAALESRSVGHLHPELVEPRGGHEVGDEHLARSLQVGISSSESDLADVVVHESIAGTQAADFEVVIKVPTGFQTGTGADMKTRNQGGEVSRLGEKRNGCEIRGGGENIATARD